MRLPLSISEVGLSSFQFTHPVWGATVTASKKSGLQWFQFTHPVWGATSTDDKAHSSTAGFNSRTPCGVRLDTQNDLRNFGVFQFTHPVWGATYSAHRSQAYQRGFNSRTPCGVRLISFQGHSQVRSFNSRTPCGVRPFSSNTQRYTDSVSIHAPRVGCDFFFTAEDTSYKLFQFTHPVWGATDEITPDISPEAVSIHAPRVGCDKRSSTLSLL